MDLELCNKKNVFTPNIKGESGISMETAIYSKKNSTSRINRINENQLPTIIFPKDSGILDRFQLLQKQFISLDQI